MKKEIDCNFYEEKEDESGSVKADGNVNTQVVTYIGDKKYLLAFMKKAMDVVKNQKGEEDIYYSNNFDISDDEFRTDDFDLTELEKINTEKKLAIAFMNFDGYNYEDAVILNERLAKKDVLTSIHISDYQVGCGGTKFGPEEFTRVIPNVSGDARKNLDENGIIQVGTVVKDGDILVGKVTPFTGRVELTAEEKLLHAIFGGKAREVLDTSLRVQHGGGGIVHEVKVFTKDDTDELPVGDSKVVRVYIAQKRKISINKEMVINYGKGLINLNNVKEIKIGIASPEKILEWSYGEVTKADTINHITLKTEKEGLYCEKIFGPTRDYECYCKKYKGLRYKNIICDRCGVKVTLSKVRRERMGHIKLATPVSHIWFVKGVPSRMGLVLDLDDFELKEVLYYGYRSHYLDHIWPPKDLIVLDPGVTPLEKKQIISDKEYRAYYEKYGNNFRVGTGAEAIKELLEQVNIDDEIEIIKEKISKIKNTTCQKRMRLKKRLDVLCDFQSSNNKPEWMIMTVLPVISPELRPIFQLDSGRFSSNSLNDLYRRVINRNNRIKMLIDSGAPSIMMINEKRMLQEAVDALLDELRYTNHERIPSLSDVLIKRPGRFRKSLLKLIFRPLTVPTRININQIIVPRKTFLSFEERVNFIQEVMSTKSDEIKSQALLFEELVEEIRSAIGISLETYYDLSKTFQALALDITIVNGAGSDVTDLKKLEENVKEENSVYSNLTLADNHQLQALFKLMTNVKFKWMFIMTKDTQIKLIAKIK